MAPSKKKQSEKKINLTALIDNYKKKIGAERPNNNKEYVQHFKLTSNDADKARMLLGIKGHQWYLQCFHKETCDKLLEELENDKPWNQPFNNCSSFEDLFEIIRHQYERQYVKQLVIYDISLHIAIIKDVTRFLPKDFVYIHAKPLANYKLLRKHIKELPKLLKGDRIPFCQLSPFFPGLSAREIEDFLCVMDYMQPCEKKKKKVFVGDCN